MKAVAIIFAALAVVSQAVPIPWKNCAGSAPTHLKITEAVASEWPPQEGTTISFTIAGTLDENVSSGTYLEEVWFDGIMISDKSGTLASLNISHIPSGPFNITKSKAIPNLGIGGDVKIHVEVKDQNNQYVACVEAEANIPGVSNHVNNKRIINHINTAVESTWVAGENKYFADWSVQDAKVLMGYKRNPNRKLSLKTYSADIIANLPESFSWVEATNNTCVGPVLDQGKCGACWAFGAAEAISDRLCIASGGPFLQLAPLDLVSCDDNDNGCQGGDPGSAWEYAQSSGLVTESCLPYLTSEGGPIPTCPPSTEPCLTFVNTPNCVQKCHNGHSFSGDKHHVTNVYGINGVQQMMAELTQSGPIEAAFTVYSDFLTYKSGVYQYKTGQELGGHAIEIVGYGTENGVPYWLCKNSWTTTWGDQGYFKILKGQDECGIEDDVVAGTIDKF